MAKFRKRPVEIEAEQFFPDRSPLPFADRSACCLGPNGWYVVTAHGHDTPIAPGDWIIPEPDGRGFYPCKPDIFEATYALAAHPAAAAGDAEPAGWRPIETAPKDGTEILLWQPNRGAAHVGSWHPVDHWHIGAVTHCHPTHWQPACAAESG